MNIKKTLYKLLSFIPDNIYLRIMFLLKSKKILHLKNPKTFNEKLQWLKLNDKNPAYTRMVDKFEVKNIISDKIGNDYIIPTIGIYDNFEEIDFNKLPNQFVMKCTHDSGGLVICKDKKKLDINAARKKINSSLKYNYFYGGREYPYKNVKRRVLIEKYMEDDKTKELRDYKFFCFDGKVKFFKVDFNRNTKHQANYYDTKLNLLKFGEKVCPPDYEKIIEFPTCIDNMIELSNKLSSGFKFVRIDLYCSNNKIFFGEFTLYPASGFGRFIPNEWDNRIGELIVLDDLMEG